MKEQIAIELLAFEAKFPHIRSKIQIVSGLPKTVLVFVNQDLEKMKQFVENRCAPN